MEGLITSFRRGKRTQTPNQIIIEVKGYENKEKAKELIGKEVVWKSPAGKEIKGKVANFHGNKGKVRVIFEKGLPGQSIATKVTIS